MILNIINIFKMEEILKYKKKIMAMSSPSLSELKKICILYIFFSFQFISGPFVVW